MTPTHQDMTLDEVRAALAPILPRHAAFDGWRREAVTMAAEQCGIDADIATLAFPGGAMEMIDAWFESIDSRMREALPQEKLATLSIRMRITTLVETRLTLLGRDRVALRRAQAVMAMPRNAAICAGAMTAHDRLCRAIRSIASTHTFGESVTIPTSASGV